MTSSEGQEERVEAPAVSPPRGVVGTRTVFAVTLGVLLLAVAIRVVISGSGALERGNDALAVGDHLGATAAWREAISWYLPLAATWREPAMDQLDQHAKERAEAGDLPGAVMALSSLRSGIMAGHGLLRPDEDRLAEVDVRLAGLLADWEALDARESGRTVEGDRSARVAFYGARLAQDPRPDRLMSVVAMLGMLLWLVSMFRAAEGAATGTRRWWALAVVGLAMMLTGVALA